VFKFTAHDILGVEASRTIAEAAATTIRDAMQKQSGRRLTVTVAAGPGEAGVVAMAEVLGEFAYVIDGGPEATEADLQALAEEFPAVGYLTKEARP